MTYPTSILKDSFGKPPQAAVEFMKSKVSKTSFDWWEVLEGSHQKAFTVAKATQAEVLTSIRDAVEKAFESGQTFKDFQADLEPRLRRLGWWGKDSEGNILGTPYRLENIYRTNTQQAFNAGRENRLRQSRATPFSKYVAVLDSRTRPSHAALNGIVAANDSSFWETYTPSNGYQCRCRKTGVSERQIERQGLTVTDFKGKIGSKEVPINKSKGIFGKVSTVKLNGKAVSPDVGFSSNPLKAWNPDLKKYPPKIAASLKKDLKKAPKVAKTKAKQSNVEKIAKKSIKAEEKPKNLKETLKKSEEFLKPWTSKIERIEDFEFKKVGPIGKIKINGESVIFNEANQAEKVFQALKNKTFRLQALEVAKVQKSLSLNSEIASLKEIQSILSKHVREAQRRFEGLEDSPFLDFEIIGKKIRIGSDDYDVFLSDSEISSLKKLKEMQTANDQLNLSNSELFKSYGPSIFGNLKQKIRDQMEKNAFQKGNFLGYNLQETSLPSGFDPLKIPQNKVNVDSNLINTRMKAASDFWKRNLSQEMVPSQEIPYIKVISKGNQSSYNLNSRTIEYLKIQQGDTIVHEMTHHLHATNARIENVVEEFFVKRTIGEGLKKCKNYSSMQLRDSWADEYQGIFYFKNGDHFSNYAKKDGSFDFEFYKKNYPKYPIGTELLTRGIQMFFFSRADFYAKDPEFFELVSSILRGMIPQ